MPTGPGQGTYLNYTIVLTHHPTNLPAKTADATYPAYLAVLAGETTHKSCVIRSPPPYLLQYKCTEYRIIAYRNYIVPNVVLGTFGSKKATMNGKKGNSIVIV